MFSVNNWNTHSVYHFHCTRCKICRTYSAWILVKATFSLFRKVGSRCTEEFSLLWQTKMGLNIFSWSSWWCFSHTTVSIRYFRDWIIVAWVVFMLSVLIYGPASGGVVCEYFCVCVCLRRDGIALICVLLWATCNGSSWRHGCCSSAAPEDGG